MATLNSAKETNVELVLTQTEDGKRVTIPKKDVSEAPRVLGVHVAADGNWAREVGRWKTEAAVFPRR